MAFIMIIIVLVDDTNVGVGLSKGIKLLQSKLLDVLLVSIIAVVFRFIIYRVFPWPVTTFIVYPSYVFFGLVVMDLYLRNKKSVD